MGYYKKMMSRGLPRAPWFNNGTGTGGVAQPTRTVSNASASTGPARVAGQQKIAPRT